MQQTFHMRGEDGKDYDVPANEMAEFKQYVPNATRVNSHVGKDGKTYDVPENETEEFKQYVPDAQPTRRLSFADGSTREFTMPELSKFLRSKEWREDERYAADREDARQRNEAAHKGLAESPDNVAWAATKGAAQGAWAGAKSGVGKVVAALPEAAASVAEAAGNALEEGGNAPNAVGSWLRNSGRGLKRWLDENVKGDVYDANGNRVMSGLEKNLGYMDDLAKVGEIAGDAAGMAIKFAPAAVAGPAYVETILASDGINAYRNAHDAAVDRGFDEWNANLAGACAGLINYYGGKLLMKSGDVAGAWTKNALGQFLASGGVASAAMGAQAAGNKMLENITEGRPMGEGAGRAAGEAAMEGGMFHVLNAAGHGGWKAAASARREVAYLKDLRKENLLTVAENGGGDFLDRVTRSEGMEDAVKARKEGKDVSRKMGERADLPDNMSVAERNKVVDAIVMARKIHARQNRVTPDEVQSKALDEAIAEIGGEGETAKVIREEVLKNIDDAKELDDPQRRAELVADATNWLMKRDATPGVKPAEEAERSSAIKAGEESAGAGEPRAEEATKPSEPKAEEAPRTEKPVEAPRSAPKEEGTTTPPKATEGAEGGKTAENGEKPQDLSDLIQETEEFPLNPKNSSNMEFPVGTIVKRSDGFTYIRVDGELEDIASGEKEPKWQEHGVVGRPGRYAVQSHVIGGTSTPERGGAKIITMPPQGGISRQNGEERRPTERAGQNPDATAPTESAAAKTEEQEAKEARREAFRNDPVLQRIDAEYKKAKTDAERNALRDAFEARVKELQLKGLKVPKDAAPTEHPKEEAPKAEAEAEAPKPKSKGRKTKAAKADAKKAAKVVENFVSKYVTRKALSQVHHDHEGGVAVATDGRVLIATKHGYDKNAKDDPGNPYPNWRQVVPNYDGETYEATERTVGKSGKSVLKKTEHPVQKVEVDPAAISDTCRKVAALANKIGDKGTIHAALKLPDGKVVIMDAAYLRKVADAMAANGITEIKAVDGKRPILAKNADTTIVAMPLRVDGTDPTEADLRKGRGGSGIVIDALTGRILSAPERSDNTAMTSRKWADELKRQIARGKKDATDKARKMALYKAITDAWKNGEKDPRKIYDGYAGEGEFDKLKNASDRELFVELLKLGDKDALAERLAEYEADHFPQFNRWRKDLPREVEKIEKRIAAEDEIDALMGGERREPAGTAGGEARGAEGAGANAPKRLYTKEGVTFKTPIVGKTGAKVTGYVWPNKGLEYTDKNGNDRVKRISDWDFGETSEDTGRQIIHQFTVEMPDGSLRTVSAESAAKLLGISAGEVKGDALRQIRYATAIASMPEAQRSAFERKSKTSGFLKPDDSVALMKDGNLRILGWRGKEDGVTDRWHWQVTTITPDGKIKTNRLATEPKTKGFKLDGADILAQSEAQSEARKPADLTLESRNTGELAAEPTGKEPGRVEARTPEEEIEERLDLRRLDPKRRSDPKVLEWAKKQGRTVTDGMATPDAVRAYDEAMTEAAAKVVNRRWFPDMNIVTYKYGEKIKRGQHVLDIRDTAGRALGWFDPKSKEVHLLPGADPQTVAHEIMWHGTRQYMTERAAKGDARAQKFLDMMHDVEKNAPQDIKDIVNRLYMRGGVPVDRDTLLNEYGAWFTMRRGGYALEKAMQKAENRNWFAKGLHAVKEMFKDFLVRHGRNRVDISKVDGMTRDEFVDFLADQFAGGKTLGNIKEDKPALSTKETRWQKMRRKTYDQNAAVRDLQRDVEKLTGRKIAEADNVEMANALKYGLKEAANMDIQGRMRTLREKLHEGGIHFADLEYYAACKAAAGRDAKIDARNLAKREADMKAQGATPDEIDAAKAEYRSSNGSHIDPREARRMVAEIESGSQAQAYKDALAELRKTIDETLQTQVDAGLVSKAAADQWRAEEPDYVPFKNEYDPENGGWNGRGSSMSNFVAPEHRMAKGRQSAAGDIIAHVFMDHQAARHRAIENAVRQKLAKLVKAHPELGKVEKLKADAVKNIEQIDPNVVIFKQGGDSYAIRLEGTRGAAVANAFTGRETLDMRWADKGFSVYGKKISFRNFTRWSAGMATRYSPTFAVRNTLKDNIELANIIYSERGPIEGTKWMAQYAKLRAETLKNVVNVVTGHKLGINGDTLGAALGKYITTGKIDTSTEGGKILDRFIKAGGLIAGGTRSEAFSSIKDKLDPKAIEKEMRRGKSKVAAAARHTLNSIAYLNEYAEMATRVGIFATEVKGGKSDAEAALFSRRATVDFNRHGDWTPGFNLVRMFSNSTLGATARAAAALGKSKYGMVATGMIFANGLAQALIEHYANSDEDKERAKRGEATGKDVSEFDRRTSLFYFRSGDKLYRIAQHESPFSLIKYAGDCVGRWLCGEISGKQMAKNLGVNAAEIAYNFLPMGSINLTSRKDNLTEDFKAAIVSGIFPSALQPIAEIAFDMDFKGDPVTKKLFDDFASRSHNGKAHTPSWAKATAEWIQEHTGGNAGNHKGLDVAPEVIQKLVEGYGKNLLKDVSTAFSVGEAIVKNDYSGLDPRNTPVKRDFVRPLDGNTQRYYSAMGNYKGDRKELLAMIPNWTAEERKAFVKEHPWAAAPEVDKMIQKIGELQKLEDGYRKADKRGKWVKAKEPPTEEQKAKWKAARLRYQAKFLEIAEKHGGEH